MALPRMLLAPLLLAGALTAACGDGGGSDRPDSVTGGTGTTDGSTTTAAVAGTEPSSPTTDGRARGGAFGLGRVEGPAVDQGLLADVDATADGTVDRVTFTFEGPRPGYRVEYVERPIIQDGSGDEITIDGAAVLLVHFEPASGFDLSGEGRQVYKGPNQLDLATRVILDVARVSDFEANLDWAIGVDEKAPFRVRTEDAPSRIILEVEVPPAG